MRTSKAFLLAGFLLIFSAGGVLAQDAFGDGTASPSSVTDRPMPPARDGRHFAPPSKSAKAKTAKKHKKKKAGKKTAKKKHAKKKHRAKR